MILDPQNALFKDNWLIHHDAPEDLVMLLMVALMRLPWPSMQMGSQPMALLDRRSVRCNLHCYFERDRYRSRSFWLNDRLDSSEHVSIGGRNAAGIRLYPRSALGKRREPSRLDPLPSQPSCRFARSSGANTQPVMLALIDPIPRGFSAIAAANTARVSSSVRQIASISSPYTRLR